MSRQLAPQVLVRPSRFAHFVLRVRDLERSLDWYQRVLGMEVVHRNPMLAFVTHDEEHHRIALMQTPVMEDASPGSPGLDHVAFAYDDLGDLLSSYRRLKDQGIEPYLPINHGPSTSFYYHDPDGNGVELFIDNFETEEELKRWMHSDAFEKNPIGVTFDPEELVARYEAGEPLASLVQQRGDEA